VKKAARLFILAVMWNGVRRKIAQERPTVIAVTGSVGKTSAKEAIATVLEATGLAVVKTQGNLGTDMGVPLSLFGFSDPPAGWAEWLRALWRGIFPPLVRYDKAPVYVLEYASDKPGDIAFLTDRLAPDIGVVTKVTPVHLQFFKDMDELVGEEVAVASGVMATGKLVVNADDPYQTFLQNDPRTVTYQLLAAKPVAMGWEFDVEGQNYHAPVVGRHQLYPILAAVAVGKLFGLTADVIAAQVATCAVPPGRGRLIEGRDGIMIIDDSYNASPAAVMAALEMLCAYSGDRRKVAVLGRMNELGDRATELHRKVGEAAIHVNILVAVGEFAAEVRDGALSAGLSAKCIFTYKSTEEAVEKIPHVIRSHDVVLVKGSQNGVRLERLVKSLMMRPDDAERLLVRQEAYWQ
jgi:UDP-N-acetylmuramoyl-tripeptide--D-alanyl-D-alanine ligase